MAHIIIHLNAALVIPFGVTRRWRGLHYSWRRHILREANARNHRRWRRTLNKHQSLSRTISNQDVEAGRNDGNGSR